MAALRASVDDEGSLAFADRFGFVEVDRQIEQVRAVGDEQQPSALPAGVDVVMLSEHPELWAGCYETFGIEVLADFALYTPLEISADQWNSSWAGDPMFLAVYEGDVIGCAGLHQDADQPERGENALTAVRRCWRGRGIASHLKHRTLEWAAANGLRELYTWTQAGKVPDAAPQRTPRVRRRPDQHHRVPVSMPRGWSKSGETTFPLPLHGT